MAKLQANSIKHIHPKIQTAILEFITNNKPDYKFYGHFFLYMIIREDKNMPTAGVTVKGTKMYMYYNPKLIDLLTIGEVKWLLCHELKHLLYNHVNRTISGGYDPKKSNIVQDMIINTVIDEDFEAEFNGEPLITPIIGEYKEGDGKDDFKVSIPKLRVPPEYKEERVFELLYKYASDVEEQMEDEEMQGQGQGGDGQGDSDGEGDSDGQGQGNGQSQGGGNGNGDSEELKTMKDMLRNSETGEGFDVHNHGEMGAVEKATIDGYINGIKSMGIDAGHIEGILKKLTVTRKDNLKWIKQQMAQIMGDSPTKSWQRMHRYGIKGAKGDKYVGNEINAILDVSGSMHGLLEPVLSNLYQNNIVVNLVLADTRVTEVYRTTSKKELQNIKISGYGGTDFQPAIDYVAGRKDFIKNNTVILTDGYCPSIDIDKLRGRTLIITTDELVNVIGRGKRVKQIKMERGDL